jgi:hypothetical protein
VSRYLTGACIEDVNHGLWRYLQPDLRRGFQEPPPALPVKVSRNGQQRCCSLIPTTLPTWRKRMWRAFCHGSAAASFRSYCGLHGPTKSAHCT